MVQVVENLTLIRGRILARKAHPSLDHYDLVSVSVEQAEPVEGKADLLSRLIGTQTELAVRSELLGSAQPGDELRCHAKATVNGAMCLPHPGAREFSVMPAGGPR